MLLLLLLVFFIITCQSWQMLEFLKCFAKKLTITHEVERLVSFSDNSIRIVFPTNLMLTISSSWGEVCGLFVCAGDCPIPSIPSAFL